MKNYISIPKKLWSHQRFIELSPLGKFAVICGITAQAKQKKTLITLDILTRYLNVPINTLAQIVNELIEQEFMQDSPDWGYIFDFNL